MAATQRFAHQPARAHRNNCQKACDLAREAVGCMGGLGGNALSGFLIT